MTSLSKYQTKILNQLREEGLFLWTNEGEEFKAWIGDESGIVKKYV